MCFPILNGVENRRFPSWKIGDIPLKIVDFNLNFQGEDQSYANFLFYILIV